MIPLVSKSLAAQLNISKDKGPDLISFELNFSEESSQRGISAGSHLKLWN